MIKTNNDYWAFPIKMTHGLTNNFPVMQTIAHSSNNEGSSYYWPHLTFQNGIADYHFNVSTGSGNGASITDTSLFPQVIVDATGTNASISNALAWKITSNYFNVMPFYDSTIKTQGANYGGYDPYIHKVMANVSWRGQTMNAWKSYNTVTQIPLIRFDKNKTLNTPIKWCIVRCLNCFPVRIVEQYHYSSTATTPKLFIDEDSSGVVYDNWDLGDSNTEYILSPSNSITGNTFSRRIIRTDSSGGYDYTWYLCCMNNPRTFSNGSMYMYCHPISLSFQRKTSGQPCACTISNFGMTFFKGWEF